MPIEQRINKFINEKLIPFVFITSNSPILFADLLEANRQLKDQIVPNATQLGYRIRTTNMYIAFFILVHIAFILPGTAITHALLAKLNCHLSIIAAVVITGLFFTWFTLFREFLVDRVSFIRVQIGWKLHFPLFDFNEYSDKVAKIYTEAVKKKIPRGELEFFVMSELAKEQD